MNENTEERTDDGGILPIGPLVPWPPDAGILMCGEACDDPTIRYRVRALVPTEKGEVVFDLLADAMFRHDGGGYTLYRRLTEGKTRGSWCRSCASPPSSATR